MRSPLLYRTTLFLVLLPRLRRRRRALEEACAEAAVLHISETDGLMPIVTDPGIARKASTVGPIKSDITYVGSRSGLKRFTIVEMLLSRLILPFGRVERG